MTPSDPRVVATEEAFAKLHAEAQTIYERMNALQARLRSIRESCDHVADPKHVWCTKCGGALL